jgi:hypothetical protein
MFLMYLLTLEHIEHRLRLDWTLFLPTMILLKSMFVRLKMVNLRLRRVDQARPRIDVVSGGPEG